jgi:MASE6
MNQIESLVQRGERWFTPTGTTVDLKRRRMLVAVIILTFAPQAILFAIFELLGGNIVVGTIVIPLAVLAIGFAFYSRKIINFNPIAYGLATALLVVVTYEIHVGHADGVVYLWFLLFPVMMFYVFGVRIGAVFVGAALLISMLHVFNFLGQFTYPVSLATRFLTLYVLISVISLAKESTRELYNRRFQEEQEAHFATKQSLDEISELLPICSNCKKIRNDTGYWDNLESYFLEHRDLVFTHGICPDCSDEMLKEIE